MLFCIINYFQAYGILSGYNVKGHYVICKENTSFTQLKHGQKIMYTKN